MVVSYLGIMKPKNLTIPLFDGYYLRLDFYEDELGAGGGVDGFIETGGDVVGHLSGVAFIDSSFMDFDEDEETARCYSFFAQQSPEALDCLRLRPILTEKDFLYLQRITLDPMHRGKKVGVAAIKAFVSACQKHHGINTTISLIFPLQHENPESDDLGIVAGDRNEDMKRLTAYYTRELAPVAWLEDYMILVPSDIKIPPEMSAWKSKQPELPVIAKDLLPFLKGDTWVVLGPHGTVAGISRVDPLKQPDGMFKTNQCVSLHFIDSVLEEDLNLKLPPWFSVTTDLKEIPKLPIGSPVMRWASPDGIAWVELRVAERSPLSFVKKCPWPYLFEVVSGIGKKESNHTLTSHSLTSGIVPMLYAVLTIEHDMERNSAVYKKNGVTPQPPTPEFIEIYENLIDAPAYS